MPRSGVANAHSLARRACVLSKYAAHRTPARSASERIRCHEVAWPMPHSLARRASVSALWKLTAKFVQRHVGGGGDVETKRPAVDGNLDHLVQHGQDVVGQAEPFVADD